MDAAQLYMMHTAAERRPKPARERHVVSVFFSLAHMVLVCVAMAEEHWSTLAYMPDGTTKIYGLFGNQYQDSQDKALVSAVVLFLFLSIAFSMIGLIFSCGYPRELCRCMRHNSLGNVLAVLCCVMACSFWYWFIHNVNASYIAPKPKNTVTVTFGFSFYILVGAGVCSVIAAAFNLFQSKPPSRHGNRRGTSGYSMLSISADDTDLSSPPAYAP